jgi:hypothetical protein
MHGVRGEAAGVRLAEVLGGELGADCRAGGWGRHGVRCYHRGFNVWVEVSHSRGCAEEGAGSAVERGPADLAVALQAEERLLDVPEQQLPEALRGASYSAKILVQGDYGGALLQFLERSTGRKAGPAGWFEGLDLPSVKALVEGTIDFMAREEEAGRLEAEARSLFQELVRSLAGLDPGGGVRARLYDVLYRLYGLSATGAGDPDVVFGHAALSIMLATILYEHVRSARPGAGLQPVARYVDEHGAVEGLGRAFRDLLRLGYRAAVEPAIEILDALPQHAEGWARALADLAVRIASRRGLLGRDLAGRLYHRVAGDIALRKGLATFYTEVPAAHLLATLAALSLLGLDERSPPDLSEGEARRVVDRVRSVKVGDFACGSGTLLTASYNALTRAAATLRFHHGLDDVDLNGIGRALVEEGVYGVDVLRYASQITALNLALVGPGAARENIYTIHLGYMPGRGAWLGSLELLNSRRRVGGILAYLEGGLRGAAERVSVEGAEGAFSVPSEFDIIIMNPPFTRATGRTERFEEEAAGERGLFGFIVDAGARRNVIEAYERVRESVRSDLEKVATNIANILPTTIRDIVLRKPREFRQYLAVGQAGEGLLFLYLAYKYVKNGGVIAFVLPRGLLAGASWFLARTLLASEFHVKYIIVSSDPEKGYNFSEGTSLSETLIVARRVDGHEDGEETVFVNLLRKPSAALEAAMLAEEVRKAAARGGHAVVEAGGSRALVYRVGRRELLDNIDNWNRLAFAPDAGLLRETLRLHEDGVLPGAGLRVPLVRLNEIAGRLGVDRHQFHDHFRPAGAPTPYPVVYGGGEEVRRRMLVEPNAFAEPRTGRAGPVFEEYSGRVLLPSRVWLGTARALALYSGTPTLSNMFYALRLKPGGYLVEHAEKALVLWLNTTWGLLAVLAGREETRGPWIQLKAAHWRLLRVLDVTALDGGRLRRLAEAFDRHAGTPLERIPRQFNPDNPDPARLGIDRDFVKALDPALEDEAVERGLRELYKRVDTALKLWIG